MNEHEKQTVFLQDIILYDDTEERYELEKRIAQVLRDQRCVKRATSVAAVFPFLIAAGFAYGMILRENFPYAESDFVVRVVCELGLASLICLAVFAGFWTFYRRKLNRFREECRQLVKRLLLARLGQPHVAEARMSTRGISVEPDVARDAGK